MSLAKYIGMKPASLSETKDEQYRLYTFKMTSSISREGSLEIEAIEFYGDLPKEKILEFFRTNKFDISSVPKAFAKWALIEEYFSFRKKDERLARQEKKEEIIEEQAEYEKRLTLDTIAGVYIPKDLGECFLQLDQILPDIERKDMQALPRRTGMIRYHLDLGMWMRNNWGLHGGSRLQKYFRDRRITDPEEMSTIILYYYHDWLNGKKEAWQIWDKDPAPLFSKEN